MRKFLIRFLIFLSGCSFIFSCSQYRHMQRIESGGNCIEKFKPDFHHVEYKTSVDVVGKHISGLLLIKQMPDSSTRIVFTNEMGFGFFDFGFPKDSGFVLYYIVPQMNKKPLVKTLRKDFELILFRHIDDSKPVDLRDSDRIYHGFPQEKGINYYITDSTCSQLIKMQRSSNRKPIMEAAFYNSLTGNSPDSISIQHLNFNFAISLKKINLIAN
jgi:hypothetical protein